MPKNSNYHASEETKASGSHYVNPTDEALATYS